MRAAVATARVAAPSRASANKRNVRALAAMPASKDARRTDRGDGFVVPENCQLAVFASG
jgi:hypothetical protein|tara:strand:+ start:8068 stop:8244 length:177 start_codon:yes stop_codon:yes gene_type:complete